MKSSWKRNGLVYVIIVIAAIVLLSTLMNPGGPKPTEVTLSRAVALSQAGEIKSVVIDGEEMLITLQDDTEAVAIIGDLKFNELTELGFVLPPDGYEVSPVGGINWGSVLLNFLPIIFIGFLLFFLFRQARAANSQGMNFGRSRARLFPANRVTVTFADVAGADEAKQDMQEVVEFLKAKDTFQALGARIPKGVLLVGPPGTGKTLLARAVAGEADVPFFSISGSEFVEMFVGVGASRVRDLFEQAKRNAPCIVFIDEIDAVGRQRGSGLGGSHDEREQTLNQILVEMDGFDTNTNVIVIAATNRPDILDPALLRPGRFDRRVIMDAPDINGRVGILKVHSNGKPLDKDVDLENIARGTVGFSGADLANLVNEAAILAARRGKKTIGMDELQESIDRVSIGPERKSRKMSAREKEITAYHEAGHALVGHLLPNADPVQKVSIVSRGMAGGYTKQVPIEDRNYYTRSHLKDMLAFALGGRAAEEIVFDEITSGAKSDIEHVTKLARAMVTDYGMSDKLGPRSFGHKEEMVFLGREISEQRDYSEKVALQIDNEVREIIEAAHKTAHDLLMDNREKLDRIAKALLEKETLEGDELDMVINGELSAASHGKVKETKTPVPVEPSAEEEQEPKPKTAPGMPRLVPKHTPAPSD